MVFPRFNHSSAGQTYVSYIHIQVCTIIGENRIGIKDKSSPEHLEANKTNNNNK